MNKEWLYEVLQCFVQWLLVGICAEYLGDYASERQQPNRNLSSPQVKAIGHQILKTPGTFFESWI
jgi:hypothetical protein